ncbi:MAG: hypothetical protein HUK22_02935, partial [Thermoguttaceae bacterium]|nr:hypothetical protein [Thermoguttaceae bacterium]
MTPVPPLPDATRRPVFGRRVAKYAALFAPAALFFGLFAAFFAPSFAPDARFAYRDVGFFYYPLFEQIQAEWDAGRAPLWDPYENLGQPLAGNPTASVFYPGKIVFFLSSLGLVDYANCFKAYIYAHALLACFGAYFLARRMRISRDGAALVAVAYAFSGPILFQYSNVIYLVGAAWTPSIFLCGFNLFARSTFKRKIAAALRLGVVDSLAILGGEPQIVYLTTLAFAFFALFSPMELESPRFGRVGRALASLLLLAVAASSAAVLAAPQIFASIEVIRRSERVADDPPRSIWELGAAKLERETPDYAGILCQDFDKTSGSRSIYRFSVGPWRWAEYFFPNVGGLQYPKSGRWFSAFPEEIAVWSPTLYAGVVPAILALAATRFRRRPKTPGKRTEPRRDTIERFRAFFSWLAVVGILGALGGFGGGWALRAARFLADGKPLGSTLQNGDPVGGLYWLMNLTLPKFADFRYPEKLLTLTAISAAVLAGLGWDAAKCARRLNRRTTIIGVATLAAAGVGWLSLALWGADLFHEIQTIDPLFGPFQPRLAAASARGAFVQTAVVLAVVAACIIVRKTAYNSNRLSRLTKRRIGAACLAAALATTALDVFAANGRLVVVAPSQYFESRGEIAQTIENRRLAEIRAANPALAARLEMAKA